jgi:hypothetical protein
MKQRNVGTLDPLKMGDCFTFIALDGINQATVSTSPGSGCDHHAERQNCRSEWRHGDLRD